MDVEERRFLIKIIHEDKNYNYHFTYKWIKILKRSKLNIPFEMGYNITIPKSHSETFANPVFHK